MTLETLVGAITTSRFASWARRSICAPANKTAPIMSDIFRISQTSAVVGAIGPPLCGATPRIGIANQNISGTLCYMQSSRDSSVWRSLAVAFGDGVAFGVGVKLSQSAASHVNATALADPSPAREPESPEMASRLEEFERRLAKMEQAKTLPPVHAQFDQKVLEAVVNALDARLKEQAGAVERRIAELEARLTIELTALRRQDETIAAAVEDHMEKLQDHFIAQVEAVRQQVEQDHAAMHEEVAASVRKASELAIEEKIAPVREAAAEKDRDLAALRQRLED